MGDEERASAMETQRGAAGDAPPPPASRWPRRRTRRELRRRSRALRDRSAATTAAQRGGVAFSLDGLLAERSVRATYHDGTLRCDEVLYSHAALLVDLGEAFEVEPGTSAVPASLTSDGTAILLTLVRAVDRVVDLRVEVA